MQTAGNLVVNDTHVTVDSNHKFFDLVTFPTDECGELNKRLEYVPEYEPEYEPDCTGFPLYDLPTGSF